MKKNFLLIGKYLLQVILTAIASALVALLQNYLATHTGNSMPELNPEHVAKVGGILSTTKIAFNHYKKIGGTENYAHLKGLAVDILCKNDAEAYQIILSCLTAGFKRIGIGKGHI